MPIKIAVSVASQVTGLVDDAERQQHVIEQAIALQDGDPGIDADQERGPERQDHRDDQHRLQASAALRAMP